MNIIFEIKKRKVYIHIYKEMLVFLKFVFVFVFVIVSVFVFV